MTKLAKFVLTVLVLGAIAAAAWRWTGLISSGPIAHTESGGSAPVPDAALVETATEVPSLPPMQPYVPKDGVLDVELSEYAGYAGLIVANGGLEPNADSPIFRKFGIKLRIKLSEEESWPALNEGKMAASATTADVLAVYGRQFGVVVPVQIGFSRGADGVVVLDKIRKINDLRGSTLVTAQFTEADFFIRYLALEGGLGIRMLQPGETPDPEKLNLAYAADAFESGDIFLESLSDSAPTFAGCVTWAPKTSEVVNASGGRARILTTNRNLLIIADILIVNRGFAEKHPEMVEALSWAVISGNETVRNNPETVLPLINKAFGWTAKETREELQKIHFSNLPENRAFFSGAIDSAGSFGGIYQSAIYAYGTDLIKNPVDSTRFFYPKALDSIEASGEFKRQVASIQPIRSTDSAAIETDPLLSKNIRFLFQPNSFLLEENQPENAANMEALRKLLQISPGSTILLRGHVDAMLVPQFRAQGGEAFVRQMALKAMELSRNRALEVRRVLVEKYKVPSERLETAGRGWEEPVGTDSDANRRVEAQWFTVE